MTVDNGLERIHNVEEEEEGEVGEVMAILKSARFLFDCLKESWRLGVCK